MFDSRVIIPQKLIVCKTPKAADSTSDDDEFSSPHSVVHHDIENQPADNIEVEQEPPIIGEALSSPIPMEDKADESTQELAGPEGAEQIGTVTSDLVEKPAEPLSEVAPEPLSDGSTASNSSMPPPLPSRDNSSNPPPLPPRRRAPFFWLKDKGGAAPSITSLSSDGESNHRSSLSLNSPDYDLVLQRIDATHEGIETAGVAEKDAALQGRRLLQMSFKEFREDYSASHEDTYDEESTAIDWAFWSEVVSDYPTIARHRPAELNRAIMAGFPPQLRGLIWQLIASSKNSSLESIFNQIVDEASPHEKAIKRDLSRTSFTKSVDQESLFRIIKGYSLFDPEVGYTQGMAFITVPILMNMSEPEAFCLLVHFMKDYDFRNLFLPDMPGLHLKLYQFDRILEDTLPAVHIHLSRQGVRSSMYASQWFLTLFAYKFPLALVMRIFDIVISEGLPAILKFGVALMKRNEEQILSQDFDKLLVFLKDHVFDYYRNDSIVSDESTYRVNDLVQDAYAVKILPMTLKKYENEYAEIHRLERERVEEVESLRSANGHLSLQLRRLEEQLAALNSEHIQVANEMVQGKLELARLQDENELLTNEVRALKISNENYQTVESTPQDELRDQNRELLETKARLESQLSNLEKELVETRMDTDRLIDDNKSLRSKWDSLLKHINS